MEKQTEKQIGAIQFLDFFNKISELDQLKYILLENQFNYLIIDKLKKINELQNIIKSGEMDYESRTDKQDFYSKYSLPVVF